jgi:hypothetical protein
VHQQIFLSQSRNKLAEQGREREEEPKKGPLQCWGCGETHLLRDCPHIQHDSRIVYNIQGKTIVDDIAMSVPRIYATV